MRPIGGTATFAVVAALLVACTSSGADPTSAPPSSPRSSTLAPTPSPPPSTPTASAPPSPTVPADVPTTGPNTKPGERPPVMPIAATKHTADGARAFAKFFIQTIDWGYATTSSAYMRRYYQPTCNECRVTRLLLDNAHRRGAHYFGSRVMIVKVDPPTRGGPKNAELSIHTVINISSVEVIDKTGRASHPDVAHNGFGELVSVKWRAQAWTAVWIHGQDNK